MEVCQQAYSEIMGLRGIFMEGNKQKKERRRYMKKYNKWYLKTKKGFIQRLYTKMKSRISGSHKTHIKYYVGKGLLTKEEFYQWIYNHPKFDTLFLAYQESGYDKMLSPSVDRIDSSKGYEINNIRLVAFVDNLKRPRPRGNLLSE